MTAGKIGNIKLTPVNVEARKKVDFSAGDTVKVQVKILEEKKAGKKDPKKATDGPKYRLQAFEGIVLARKHGTEIGATFTVRKVASGVGVERVFPLFSPMIEKIEVTKKARARRAKLYYVRTKAVKDVRKKLRSVAFNKTDDAEDIVEVEEVKVETPEVVTE